VSADDTLPASPKSVAVGGLRYKVEADGYCPALDCWIYYDRDFGGIITIPAD
jgi:hypothetical protein